MRNHPSPSPTRKWARARVLSLSIAAVAGTRCAPAPHHCPTISWPGRSPVCVVAAQADGTHGIAQRLLDRGRAVDITGNTDPTDGLAHVAGHYHGVFAAGPRLRPGVTVIYAGTAFHVVGDSIAHAGDPIELRPGLTIQYSLGHGAVRLVLCDALPAASTVR